MSTFTANRAIAGRVAFRAVAYASSPGTSVEVLEGIAAPSAISLGANAESKEAPVVDADRRSHRRESAHMTSATPDRKSVSERDGSRPAWKINVATEKAALASDGCAERKRRHVARAPADTAAPALACEER